jgi:hypothetical protein
VGSDTAMLVSIRAGPKADLMRLSRRAAVEASRTGVPLIQHLRCGSGLSLSVDRRGSAFSSVMTMLGSCRV